MNRLLYGSPLHERVVARAVFVLLVVVLLMAALSLGMLVDGLTRPVASVFLRALAWSSALSFVPIAIIAWLDRRERENGWVLAIAFVWGGLIATGLALPSNSLVIGWVGDWLQDNPGLARSFGTESATLLAAPICAPLVEESTKALGIVLLFVLLRAEFDNMRDGFVYGAMVGAGFNWFEAPLYIAQNHAEHGVPAWDLHFGIRYALFGMSGHALFSGLFGAYLGSVRQIRLGRGRWLAPLRGFGVAWLAHTINNLWPLLIAIGDSAKGTHEPLPADPGAWSIWWHATLWSMVMFGPFLGLAGSLLWRSGQWERRVIGEELALEASDIATDRERIAIAADQPFRTRRIAGLPWRASACLVNAQHELAFRKRRVRDSGGDPDTDPLVLGWRDEIRSLRADSAAPSARRSA